MFVKYKIMYSSSGSTLISKKERRIAASFPGSGKRKWGPIFLNEPSTVHDTFLSKEFCVRILEQHLDTDYHKFNTLYRG